MQSQSVQKQQLTILNQKCHLLIFIVLKFLGLWGGEVIPNVWQINKVDQLWSFIQLVGLDPT